LVLSAEEVVELLQASITNNVSDRNSLLIIVGLKMNNNLGKGREFY